MSTGQTGKGGPGKGEQKGAKPEQGKAPAKPQPMPNKPGAKK